MWSPRAVAAAIALGLSVALAGCGFHPLYGARSAETDAALAGIKVLPIGERIGQVMRTELQDGFNPSGVRVQPVYQLEVTLVRTRSDQLIRTDGTASRTEITMNAAYRLRRIADSVLVFNGSSRSISGFDVVDNEYSNVVAGNDSELRAVRDLAEQIQTRVTLFLRGDGTQRAAKP